MSPSRSSANAEEMCSERYPRSTDAFPPDATPLPVAWHNDLGRSIKDVSYLEQHNYMLSLKVQTREHIGSAFLWVVYLTSSTHAN